MSDQTRFRRIGARGLVLALGVAVAGVVIPASPAAAAVTGTIRISASYSGGSDHFQTTTATCPSGKVLIGTGYEIYGATGEVVVDDLRPNGTPTTAPTAVTVSAWEIDPFEGNWSITAYAICSNPLPGLVQVSVSTPEDSPDFVDVVVPCPAGKVLTGGGFELRDVLGRAAVDDFRPNGSTTTAPTSLTLHAHEADPFLGPWSMTGYAICANQIPGLQVSAVSLLTSEDYRSVTATCPSDKVMTSGGYEVRGAFGEVVVDDFAPNAGAYSSPTANVVGAYEEDPFAGNWELRSFVICADR